MITFPQPNLPGPAMPWGRSVTSYIQELLSAKDRIEKMAKSDSRALSGQMGTVGRQLEELGSRVTTGVTLPSLTVTSSSTTSFASATVSGTIPGVGSNRNALISVSAPASVPDGLLGPFVTVRVDGQVVYRDTVGSGAGGRVPPEWANSLTASFSTVIMAAGSTISIQIQTSRFIAGSSSVTLSSPKVAAYFVDSTNYAGN